LPFIGLQVPLDPERRNSLDGIIASLDGENVNTDGDKALLLA
jgi:hypothetical protein